MKPVTSRAPDVLRAIGALFGPGDVIEIRALEVGRTAERPGAIHAGYFNFENSDAIAQAIRAVDGRADGVYFVLNKLNPALLARSNNRLKLRPKNTTTDADIIERRWFYIDADAVRPAGISATDSEHLAALDRVLQIREYLTELGWPEPIHADSGNGAHLLYRLPPMDPKRAEQLVKAGLKALSARFSDTAVKVDEATGNASRICKLYGTMACKGDSTQDRPHRRSMLLDTPERNLPVPEALLEALASEIPTSAGPKSGDARATPGNFDTDDWLRRTGIDLIKGPEPYDGGRRWTLKSCPFNPQHAKPVVIELRNGALAFKCYHNSCTHNDWRALRNRFEPDRAGAGKGEGIQRSVSDSPWPPPIPFRQLALPPFPTEVLPAWWRYFVEAESVATQTPPDLAAMLSVAVIAAVCAKKVVVQVAPGYSEPVNIFTVSVLAPGNRKSAVFTATISPLEEFELSESKRTAGDIASAQATHKIKQSTLKKLQEQAAAANSTAKRAEFTKEAGVLASELAELVVPVPARYIVDDCTPEKLSGLLCDQGGRMAVMSAEGDVFELMAGRYSSTNTNNFAVYLKGHAGDTLRVDRVGRPPEFVKDPALTVGLAVQPDVIRGLADKPGFRGRGLLGRFLFALPASLLGHRDIDPPHVSSEVRDGYRNGVLDLLKLPFETDEGGKRCSHALSFSHEARMSYKEFVAWIEPQLSEFGELGMMTDWGGKFAGAVVRLAGLLHMADLAHTCAPWNIPISGAVLDRACCIGRYLIPHARAAFAEMGADEVVEKAKKTLRWIEQAGVNSFTRRDVHQGMRGTFKQVADVDAPLAVLVDRGFIRKQAEERIESAGRHPSPRYDVNPKWSPLNVEASAGAA